MSGIIREPIKQVTFINASSERVYDTITSGAGWDAFFTHGTQVDARPGGSIRFTWKDWGPDRYSMQAGGPVLEAVRPKRFVFQWGSTAPTTVEFDLIEKDGGTIVRLKESGYADTPEGRAMMLECASGWGEALTLLKFYLEFGLIYTPPGA